MSYVGKWVFSTIGMINDKDEMVYLSAEEYLNSPMDYIDESDEEAVADEMRERKNIIGGQLEICEDGKLYMLMPMPDGVSEEEIECAIKEGVIKLRNGMLTDDPKAWEERDGQLWIELGEGMSDDGWAKISGDDGYINFMTIRYAKAE